jgi:hypothetical protein
MATNKQQQESFTLIDVYELQVVHFGDQGGCVGSFARFFSTSESRQQWFKEFKIENCGEDYAIYKELTWKSFVSNGDKNSLYIIQKGPVVLTE